MKLLKQGVAVVNMKKTILNKMIAKGKTLIGVKVLEYKKMYNINLFRSEVDIKSYVSAIHFFYKYGLDDYCKEKNAFKIKEILLRRKEIRNSNNYISNVMICIFTGIVSGLILLFYPKLFMLDELITNPLLQFISMIFLLMFIFCLAFTFPFILFYVFIKAISSNNPYYDYADEIELSIIDSILKEEFENY